MEWTVVLWKLGEGLLVSLGIFAITLLFSLPLGLLVAFGRMHKNPLISGIIKIYISFMRGTPLMLQLFIVYYGPYYIFKVSLHPGYRMTAVYIGFILNYAAYFAEIYRSGIQSMDRGSMRRRKFSVTAKCSVSSVLSFPRFGRRFFLPLPMR